MSVVFGVILWLFVGGLVLIGLALITPILFRVHLTNSPHFTYGIEMHLLGGLAPRLTLAQGPRRGFISMKKTKRPRPKRRKSSQSKGFPSAVIKALPGLVRDMRRHVHLVELRIDVDYGLGDPADTGQLSGFLIPLQFSHPLPASVSLNLRPDFNKACLTGSLTTAVRVTLATFFIPVVRFAWRAFGPGR